MTPDQRRELTIEEYAVRVELMRQHQGSQPRGRGRGGGAWGELEDG